jgi:3-oxoacyl-[acyl-carrier protein] reductase
VLINNAGLGGTSSVLDMTDEQWRQVLDVTLTGTFRCTRAALRRMVAQGHEPWEVANVMVFLASDYAGYMTGEVVSVSGQHP